MVSDVTLKMYSVMIGKAKSDRGRVAVLKRVFNLGVVETKSQVDKILQRLIVKGDS